MCKLLLDPPALSLPVEDNTQKKTHEVKAGEKVEFSCDAVGYPMPITVWTKDGQALAYSKNVWVLLVKQVNLLWLIIVVNIAI